MNKEIEQLVSSCATCARFRNQGPVTPLHPWKWPTRVYERVHIDYAETKLFSDSGHLLKMARVVTNAIHYKFCYNWKVI